MFHACAARLRAHSDCCLVPVMTTARASAPRKTRCAEGPPVEPRGLARCARENPPRWSRPRWARFSGENLLPRLQSESSFSMPENDSADGARPVKPEPLESGPVMRLGEVYSTLQLTRLGFDERRIAARKKQGLRPLNWGTRSEHFLSDDIIHIGRARLEQQKESQ